MKNDLQIYENCADSWWDPSSPTFRSLHAMTPYRLSQLFHWMGPPIGKRVLDCGCGGGLISKPLADAGCEVVGCDISAASLAAARSVTSSNASFVVADVHALPFEDESFDGVVLADILDHTPRVATVMKEAARVVRPGGFVYVHTINRTVRSLIMGIWVGEGLGLIPKGTHDHRFFVRPEELQESGDAAGLALATMQGSRVQLWKTLRHWAIHLESSEDMALSYSAFFTKVFSQ